MTAILPSLAKLKPNPAWASLPLFERTGWKRMAFGEFAESIGERAEPRDAPEEIYVGLEHLDPQCLHIRRSGKGSDVIGGKLRFRKGDIIFGKRRAYQRKLAVAEFGGICSAHAMVIRAKPHKVLPEFLPFLMMSDHFMDRAVEISVGSLSPTINWTTLMLESFDLPPLDQQRRFAEILWALDETICCWDGVEDKIRNVQAAKLKDVFSNLNGEWMIKPLDSVARVGRGMFSHRPRNLSEFYGGKYPFVQTGDVQNADRVLQRFEYYLTDLGTSYSKTFPVGTIFITIAAVIGATAISDREVFATDSVVGIVPSDDMDTDYLEFYLRYKRYYLENQAATQTAQKNINLQILRPLPVPCPPLHIQQHIAAELLVLYDAVKKMQAHKQKNRALLSELMNRVTACKP